MHKPLPFNSGKKLRTGFGKNAGEWTGGAEISKEETLRRLTFKCKEIVSVMSL